MKKGLNKKNNKLPNNELVSSIFPLKVGVKNVSNPLLNQKVYLLDRYQRSNQETCLDHNPSVAEGDWVQSGDLLADSAASVCGQVSLGRNLLIAYMPWEGYNFEDAILINQRLVYENVYTSLHIERFQVDTRETKYGREKITKQVQSQYGLNLNNNQPFPFIEPAFNIKDEKEKVKKNSSYLPSLLSLRRFHKLIKKSSSYGPSLPPKKSRRVTQSLYYTNNPFIYKIKSPLMLKINKDVNGAQNDQKDALRSNNLIQFNKDKKEKTIKLCTTESGDLVPLLTFVRRKDLRLKEEDVGNSNSNLSNGYSSIGLNGYPTVVKKWVSKIRKIYNQRWYMERLQSGTVFSQILKVFDPSLQKVDLPLKISLKSYNSKWYEDLNKNFSYTFKNYPLIIQKLNNSSNNFVSLEKKSKKFVFLKKTVSSLKIGSFFVVPLDLSVYQNMDGGYEVKVTPYPNLRTFTPPRGYESSKGSKRLTGSLPKSIPFLPKVLKDLKKGQIKRIIPFLRKDVRPYILNVKGNFKEVTVNNNKVTNLLNTHNRVFINNEIEVKKQKRLESLIKSLKGNGLHVSDNKKNQVSLGNLVTKKKFNSKIGNLWEGGYEVKGNPLFRTPLPQRYNLKEGKEPFNLDTSKVIRSPVLKKGSLGMESKNKKKLFHKPLVNHLNSSFPLQSLKTVSQVIKNGKSPYFIKESLNLSKLGSENDVTHLDENGIVKIGTWVKDGDILVGKITPLGKHNLSPHEKLLYSVLNQEPPTFQNTSLRVPKGVQGRVVGFEIINKEKLFGNKNGQELQYTSSRNGLKGTSSEIGIKNVVSPKDTVNGLPPREVTPSTLPPYPPISNIKNRGYREVTPSTLPPYRYPLFNNKNDRGVGVTPSPLSNIKNKRYRVTPSNLFDDFVFLKKQNLAQQKKTVFIKPTINKTEPESVHVYIAIQRQIKIGDKMAGRHGNKGIVSQILPRQDMPYLPDGTPIDILLNPLGVPSRMNVGQVFECLLGLAGKYLQQNYKIAPFDEIAGPEASRSLVYSNLFQARSKTGYQWLFNPDFPGKVDLFNGQNGETFCQPVTVGFAYILKLVHMVDKKIHARSVGPYSLITQQPVRGRSKRGGQRLGEMEVWALEGFGAAYILQEILTIKSDDISGREQVLDAILENKPFSFGTPHVFHILISELRSLCLNIIAESINGSY